MLLKLFALFVILPLVELALLLKLTDLTDWKLTLVVVIFTGFIGSLLARAQGYSTYRRIRQELSERRMPTDSLVDAVMIFVAGALLVTPGVLTDIFGMSLLIPVCRQFYRRRMKAWFKSRFQVRSFHASAQVSGHSEVVDSYVVSAGETPEGDSTEKLEGPGS